MTWRFDIKGIRGISSSVPMAEAAALAQAGITAHRLDPQDITFLSDNEQPVPPCSLQLIRRVISRSNSVFLTHQPF